MDNMNSAEKPDDDGSVSENAGKDANSGPPSSRQRQVTLYSIFVRDNRNLWLTVVFLLVVPCSPVTKMIGCCARFTVVTRSPTV